jgi:hypothetical protein
LHVIKVILGMVKYGSSSEVILNLNLNLLLAVELNLWLRKFSVFSGNGFCGLSHFGEKLLPKLQECANFSFYIMLM